MSALASCMALSGCSTEAASEETEVAQAGVVLSPDNLLRNPSFEMNPDGWVSWQGSVTRVPYAGTECDRAPDGSYVAKVARVSGTSYSIDDATDAVASVPAEATYGASVFVRAASASSVGKPVTLVIREKAGGSEVKQWRSSVVHLSNAWQKLVVDQAAPGAGHALDVFVSQGSASGGDAFYADAFELRRLTTPSADAGSPPPVPPPAGGHVPNFGAGATLLYATDYTNRDERSVVGGGWWLHYPGSATNNVWNPTYLVTVPAPWNASKKAVRAIIHKGDNWEGGGYPRSELMQVKPAQLDGGARYFVSFGFMFSNDSETYIDNNNSEMLAVLQMHHPEDGPPPFAFNLTGKTLNARCAGGTWQNRTAVKSYPLFPAGTVPVGRRIALDMEYVPTNNASGVLKIWIDGSLVVDHRGPCAYTNSGNAGYLKQGLYDYWNTVPTTLTAYFDDFVVRKQ